MKCKVERYEVSTFLDTKKMKTKFGITAKTKQGDFYGATGGRFLLFDTEQEAKDMIKTLEERDKAEREAEKEEISVEIDALTDARMTLEVKMTRKEFNDLEDLSPNTLGSILAGSYGKEMFKAASIETEDHWAYIGIKEVREKCAK